MGSTQQRVSAQGRPPPERTWARTTTTPFLPRSQPFTPPSCFNQLSSPSSAFSQLPNEIIMRIIQHLEPPSTTCLALTCRHLKAIVSKSTKSPLKGLCQSRFRRVQVNDVKHWRRIGEQAQLMQLLRTWMPPTYYLCESFAKYYLRGGNHTCSLCCPRRKGKQENMFDAEYWKEVPWMMLLGGVQRTILAGKQGQVLVRWVEQSPARLTSAMAVRFATNRT